MAPTNQQKNHAGLHLAVAEALIRGYKATFIDQPSGIEVNGHNAWVQVAAKGAWQIANIDTYLSSTIGHVVLVDITGGLRELYICPGDALRNEVGERHREFLSSKGGMRPRNPDSKHAAIYPKHVDKWHNAWRYFV